MGKAKKLVEMSKKDKIRRASGGSVVRTPMRETNSSVPASPHHPRTMSTSKSFTTLESAMKARGLPTDSHVVDIDDFNAHGYLIKQDWQDT